MKQLVGKYKTENSMLEIQLKEDTIYILDHLGQELILTPRNNLEFTAEFPSAIKFIFDENNDLVRMEILMPDGLIIPAKYVK